MASLARKTQATSGKVILPDFETRVDNPTPYHGAVTSLNNNSVSYRGCIQSLGSLSTKMHSLLA